MRLKVVPLQRESVINREEVDELDRRIIARLREDGRTSNRELARALGSSEATIRRRVRALTDGNHMKIVAIADPYQLGYTIDVIMGLQIRPGSIKEAARAFARLENVRAVTITTGAADLIIAAIFRSNEELLDFLSQQVAEIPGVIRIQTSHSLSVVKRSFDFFPEEEMR
jgi:Lrp/AsnC family transcriptional regulator, regulator for asnA, asnC and gidA